MKRILTMCDRRQTADGRPACRQARRPAADGFTLIEMLAALALAMILLYMLFQIFTTASKAMSIANARSETNANTRAILRIMHQEISGAFLDTSLDADDDDNDGDPSSTTDPGEEGDYFIWGYGETVDESTGVKNASFSQGSTQVTGTGTNWYGLVQTGDHIRCDEATSDQSWYEIISVVSDTELTLARPYQGLDASLDDYTIGRTPFLQFLTSSAVGMDGALSEVGYWLDISEPQEPILRRNMGLLGFDTGSISGTGLATLTDGTKSGEWAWETDQWVDMTVFAGGQRCQVVSNLSDQLTVTPAWDPQPDVGTGYTVTVLDTFTTADATIFGENVLAFKVEYYEGARLTDGLDNDGDGETDEPDEAWVNENYTAPERHLTPAVRITLRVRDRRGRIGEGEDFVEIIHIKGRE